MPFNKTKIYRTFEADIYTLKESFMGKTRDKLVAAYRLKTKDGEKIRRQIQKAYKGLDVRIVHVGSGSITKNPVELGKIETFKIP